MCVYIALCTVIAHNTAQNFNLPDNHHCSDDVYLREGGTYKVRDDTVDWLLKLQ